MKTSWLAATLVVLLTGCITIEADSEPEGTSTAQAAEALTKALSFEGGELVEGLMPPANASNVSLVAPSTNVLDPGSASLMSFGVDPNDVQVGAALVQFDGAESHFSVSSQSFVSTADGGVADLDAGAGDAGSGGAGDGQGGDISLAYTIEDDVCSALCDTKYSIKVKLAVKLPGDKVSTHAVATVTLDCSKTGDHDKCGKANAESGSGPAASMDTAGQGATDARDASVGPPTDDPRGDGGFGEPAPMHDASANGGDSGIPGTGMRLDSGTIDPCAAEPSAELIAYQAAFDTWKAALNNPAVRDCSSTQACLVHTTDAGNCFPVAESYDATGLDVLDADRAATWNALTDAERACNPAAGALCPVTSTCVGDVCM